MTLTPSATCPNSHCNALSKKYQEEGWSFEQVMPWKIKDEDEENKVVHEDNEWGISCDEPASEPAEPEPVIDFGDEDDAQPVSSGLVQGLSFDEGYRGEGANISQDDMVQP